MPPARIAAQFPGLIVEGYNETSPCTWDYNCIAWAVHDTKRWWWPIGVANGKAAYWPRKVPKKETIPAFEKAFATRGFKRVRGNNTDFEVGYEKIAIFALGTSPQHAARQLPDGRWAHKLGSSIDVETTILAVEGEKYGSVVRVMRRKIA